MTDARILRQPAAMVPCNPASRAVVPSSDVTTNDPFAADVPQKESAGTVSTTPLR